MSLGGLVMLFSSEIVSPVEKIEHSKGSREENPGEDVYLLSREFVILAPEGEPVGGQAGGQNGGGRYVLGPLYPPKKGVLQNMNMLIGSPWTGSEVAEISKF